MLQKVLESNPNISYLSKDVSKKIKSKYQKKFNTSLNLSNPGESYNKTDIIYPDEPSGMLLFLGTEAKNIGFLLFEIKGMTSQCFLLFYKFRGKNILQMESIILKRQPVDFKDLKQLIIDGDYW